MVNAVEALHMAASAIEDRAAERDLHGTGERSMRRCVRAFNAITGAELTPEQGWLFMVCLKLARHTAGAYHRDDMVDASGYCALTVEEIEEGGDGDGC